MNIRPLNIVDIPTVVDIHLKVLEADFITSLGRRFLERALYPTILHPSSTGFGFVQTREGKVVGFIVGLLNESRLYRTLIYRHGFICIIATVRKCLRGRKGFRQVVQTINHLLFKPMEKTGGWLYYLGIDEKYQGRGLAVRLIKHFLNHYRSLDVSHCWTKTDGSNSAAHRLYVHAGFCVQDEINMYGKPYRFYRLNL